MEQRDGHGESSAEPSQHQNQLEGEAAEQHRQLQPLMTYPSTKRQEIAATLRRLHEAEREQLVRDAVTRDEQRDANRTLVKIMHLDSENQTRIVAHTAQVTVEREIQRIVEGLRAIEDRYQAEKKALAAIQDRKTKHERVHLAKEQRDAAMAPLRERLKEIDPDFRPPSSFEENNSDVSRLPAIVSGASTEKRASSKMYRQVTEQIREQQKSRKAMLDPYMANLKMARLWMRINDHERSLENYEKALKSLSMKQQGNVPVDQVGHVLERQRQRQREALRFLFMRSLSLSERYKAADLMAKYMELALPAERLHTVAYLERILRDLHYVEDPSLSTPEAVTLSILCSKSLGPLTDLRFQLLSELLEASPHDPYLLEAVTNLHVRMGQYESARSVSERFVKLPDVKHQHLFASFAEFRPHPLNPPS